MASRKENHRNRLELKSNIRARCVSGELLPGAPAPALRDLAQEYGISTWMVTKGLEELIEEGLLHTIPRVGTFVGARQNEAENYLVLDASSTDRRGLQFWLGFENRIAQLGGTSFKMGEKRLLAALDADDLPELHGIFEMNWMDEKLRSSDKLQNVAARALVLRTNARHSARQ